jgi:hypothetical protein
MSDLAVALDALKDSLCKQIDAEHLRVRNQAAYKWKAPWRGLVLRESVAWRLHDLLYQSLILSRQNQLLGARILLRSALETLGVLIYLNRSVRAVIAGTTNFHEFSEKTSKLILGSRNKTTSHEQVSILTVLQSADKRYPGMYELYETLSETAHPNCEGMLLGYSISDKKSRVTNFQNNWLQHYGQSHEDGIMVCLSIFFEEYNNEFDDAFQALETWIERNDAKLEATKPRLE